MQGGKFSRHERFQLHAYICSQTCIRRMEQHPQSTRSFTQIYQQRPADCRYAIVTVWDYSQPPRFYVVDLFNVKKTNENKLIMPAPRLTHTDLDAAIMATVLLYNKEVKDGR